MDWGFHLSEGPVMHKLSCRHLSAAALAFAVLVSVEARCAELEGALQYPPPSVGEDQNGAAARIAAAHRIGRQRVKPTARHPAISDPPTDLGTWSTAVDRKRTIAASREPDPASWPLGAARRSS